MSIPVGTITAWSTNTAPEGWLICNGGAISRTTYKNLFNVIGTTFGTGDGKSTFNLPHIVNRLPLNTNGYIGGKADGILPNIFGDVTIGAANKNQIGGCLALSDTGSTSDPQGSGRTSARLSFDASRSSSVYTPYVTYVLPAWLETRYIIKY